MGDKPLKNLKHEAFCHAFVEKKSGRKAYMHVYSTKNKGSADSCGNALMQKPAIKERISYLQGLVNEQCLVDEKYIIERLKAIADSDIRDVIEWNENSVTFKPSSTLDDRAAYGIEEVSIKYHQKEDSSDLVVDQKVKVASVAAKLKALDSLAERLNIFKKTPTENPLETIEQIIKNAKNKE